MVVCLTVDLVAYVLTLYGDRWTNMCTTVLPTKNNRRITFITSVATDASSIYLAFDIFIESEIVVCLPIN
jgi:hypothetical protein